MKLTKNNLQTLAKQHGNVKKTSNLTILRFLNATSYFFQKCLQNLTFKATRVFSTCYIFKIPILQVVLLFRMQLWPVAHFFFTHFWVGTTAKQQQTHPKVSEKNGQLVRVAFGKEVTSYKIHTLEVLSKLLKNLLFGIRNCMFD